MNGDGVCVCVCKNKSLNHFLYKLPIFSSVPLFFLHLRPIVHVFYKTSKKGNYGKYLKGLHSEQLAKLQLKNQHECELLEDIRQFTIKRSAIEKNYSESLLKISSLYLNKKMVCIPEIKLDGTEKW